jgi:hypothetical protein
MDIIPGFAPGIVRNNNDPEGSGRVKVEIPGLLKLTPYWVMPLWPARGVTRGSRYPSPDEGHPVMVVFEYGKYQGPNCKAFYFGGYYGLYSDGTNAGPSVVAAAPTAADTRKYAVLWESAGVVAYVVDDPDTPAQSIILKAKTSGTQIVLNAADGQSGKSETITIEARTLLSLYAKGPVDISSDSSVTIQGRVVNDKTTRSI